MHIKYTTHYVGNNVMETTAYSVKFTIQQVTQQISYGHYSEKSHSQIHIKLHNKITQSLTQSLPCVSTHTVTHKSYTTKEEGCEP